MSADQKRALSLLYNLIILFMILGCASPAYRVHPEFHIRARKIERPLLLPSDIKIYEVSESGLVELRDDWCAIGRENIQNAILEGFKNKKYFVRPLTINKEKWEEMDGIQALYRAVNKSIQLHTYGPQLFPGKKKGVVYSLGPIEKILQKLEADSMIFVSAFDHISKGGQKTFVSIAVADSSGIILWYCAKGSLGGHDLRDPESAVTLVEDILSSFPEAGG